MSLRRAARSAILAVATLFAATAACAPAAAMSPASALQVASVPTSTGTAQPAAEPHRILVMLRLSANHFRPNGAYGGDYGDLQTIAARQRQAQQIARRHGLRLVGDGWPMPLVGLDCYVMQAPAGQSVEEAIAQVEKDPLVVWSQPVQTFRAEAGGGAGQGVHADRGDPLLAVEPAAKAWRLSDLHRVATGRGAVVAVVDSKVDVNHPDLLGQVTADEDYVGRGSRPERHGTGVAGVIAAREGNGVGIAGIAPGARLMALRACWETGGAPSGPTVCDSLSLAKAIHFAIDHNASIINLSLAGPSDMLLAKLLDVALARRIAVVAAYDPQMPHGGFPSSHSGVIPVAIDSLPSLPSGVYAAPGEDVPTTEPGGRWDLVNGSSFAAAHVSGLLALARELHAAPPLRVYVSNTTAAGGRIDACATVLRPGSACGCSCVAGVPVLQAAR